MKSGLAITQALLRLGPAILPFADAATKELIRSGNAKRIIGI